MKRHFFLIILFMTVIAFSGQESSPLLAGDPFILLHNGKYYQYGTNHEDGILVYESDDLKEWRLCDNKRHGFALHKSDTSATKWFWAPEVYAFGDKFIMYFTRNEHISCAIAEHPTGPFVEVGKKPMYNAPDFRIDNSLFVDDDGKAYLLFCRFVKGSSNGSEIWMGELENDRVTLREQTIRKCLNANEPWERVQARVSEGPFMLKHNGKYYLTYSANDYQSQDYAIGYAVAETPRGPFQKAKVNPILRRPAGFVGSGHHSFFKDKEGKLRIVFHVHYSTSQIHPRRVIIGTAFFENGKLRIGTDFIQPTVKNK